MALLTIAIDTSELQAQLASLTDERKLELWQALNDDLAVVQCSWDEDDVGVRTIRARLLDKYDRKVAVWPR